MHEDHVLGTFDAGRFAPTGVIDFGDVVFGAPMHELPALHLGTFHGNKKLLARYLHESGMPFNVKHALALTLLFPFNVFTGVSVPEGMTSLDELADWLFDAASLVSSPAVSRQRHPAGGLGGFRLVVWIWGFSDLWDYFSGTSHM